MTGGIERLLQGRAMAFKCCGMMLLAGVLALSGCSKLLDPVGMVHDLRGGAIAAPRQSAPGADAAYPALATVPGRPQTDDAAARGRIAAGLVADRANAQYATQSALAALPPSSPLPRRPAPAVESGMSASLDAAARTETPSTQPPRTAPVGRVAATPLVPPPAAPPSGPPAALPAVPDHPPAPASLPGIARSTTPVPQPVAPPAPPAAVAVPTGAPVAIGFADGSATLPDAVIPRLKALAAQRAGRRIAVAGFGGAADADQASQSRALPLAWERSGAIARALQAAGVPEGAITVTAQATGRGGIARLAE